MRLKEPFRGLYLMGGHTIFHLGLLLAGFIVLGIPEKNDINEDLVFTVNMLRLSHGIDIFVAILKFLGSSPEAYAKHRFSLRMFDTIKLFVYVGSVMYAIFHESNYLKEKEHDRAQWSVHAEVWLLMELLVFFGQVLCSVFFLFGM